MTSLELIACLILVIIAIPQYSVSYDDREWLIKVLTSQDRRLENQDAVLDQENPFNVYEEDRMRTLPADKRFFSGGIAKQLSFEDGIQKRYGFGGLLCCNHPPTRPPALKKDGQETEKEMEKMILQKLLHRVVETPSERQTESDRNWMDESDSAWLGDTENVNRQDLWNRQLPSTAERDDGFAIGRRGVTGRPRWSAQKKIPGLKIVSSSGGSLTPGG